MRGSARLRLVLTVLVLSALTFTALDYGGGQGGPFGALRNGVNTVFGPAQRALGGVARSVGGALGGLPRLGSYQSDNNKLRTQNDELKRQLVANEADQRRIKEFDCLMRTKDLEGFTVVPAAVSAIGAELPFQQTVTIDVGDRDQGVIVGRTVISARGLVGRIIRVGRYTSTVALLTDPTFSVGARLARVGSLGFVNGGGSGPLTLELARLDDDGQLKVGDALLTSGSSTFVPGVPIGRVSKVSTRSGQLARTAEVESFVDVGALDLLMVVVNGPRTQARVALAPSPQPGTEVAGCTVVPLPTPVSTPAPVGTTSPGPNAAGTASRQPAAATASPTP